MFTKSHKNCVVKSWDGYGQMVDLPVAKSYLIVQNSAVISRWMGGQKNKTIAVVSCYLPGKVYNIILLGIAKTADKLKYYYEL